MDKATGAASNLADFMVNLLAGSPAPARNDQTDMHAFVTDPAARKQQQLDRLASGRQAKASEHALDAIREDMEAGRALKAEDIRALTRDHQENLRAKGDDYVRQMVDESRKRAESYWKGDPRERDQ